MAVREGFEPSMEFLPHTPLAGERLQPTRPSHHIRCVGGIIRFFENMSNHFLKKRCWLLDLSTFCINKVRLKKQMNFLPHFNHL